MTEARLAAAVEASALMRQVSADGGFATILAKGDAERGSLLLMVIERGRHVAVLERMLNAERRAIAGTAAAPNATIPQVCRMAPKTPPQSTTTYG